jgi:hypothetical protein
MVGERDQGAALGLFAVHVGSPAQRGAHSGVGQASSSVAEQRVCSGRLIQAPRLLVYSPVRKNVPRLCGEPPMPKENGNAGGTVDAHDVMPQLAALSNCLNTLFKKLEEIKTGTLAAEEPPELMPLVKAEAALIEVIEFLRVCDPSEAAAKLTYNLFSPLLRPAIVEQARRRSLRSDGQMAKPAEYVLPDSIWKAILAAAADALICSPKSRDSTQAWLAVRLVGFPVAVSAATIIDWRDQIVVRMAKPQLNNKPLDIMVQTFKKLRPTRERLSEASAERLAEEWLQEAQLNAFSERRILKIPP